MDLKADNHCLGCIARFCSDADADDDDVVATSRRHERGKTVKNRSMQLQLPQRHCKFPTKTNLIKMRINTQTAHLAIRKMWVRISLSVVFLVSIYEVECA